MKCAVFGANCYWGAEAAFRKVEGVIDTAVGFMGDSLCNCSIPTSDDHAKEMVQVEVVKIEYDSAQVSFDRLIETFWCCHNSVHPVIRSEDGKPSLERSVIFVSSETERKIAEAAKTINPNPVTTSIESIGHFHRADENEQRYLERNEGAVCKMSTE